MIQALLSIIPNLIGIGADWLKSKRDLAQSKVDSQLRINEAITSSNLRLAEQGQIAEITWAAEMAKASGSSWKDEWFTIILSLPLIMSFIPGLSDYVELGFYAISNTPEWYQLSVLVAIGASFGVRIWDRTVKKTPTEQ